MSTRGFIGFVIEDEEKITYNHYDSYPDGLGADVLTWLTKAVERDPDGLRESVAALRMVTNDDPVSDEDVERLKHLHNSDVSTGSEREWYSLLRETQGNPEAILDAGVAEDHRGFVSNSLFCEWGYLIDFDTNTFEVYRGSQTVPHSTGRFADRVVEEEHREGREQYQPVARAGSWPLDDLPTEEEFLTQLLGERG